jgi:acylphosphatase
VSRHAKIRVYGLVQGVSFRAYAAREARRLGLSGFVRNEPDGSVYAEAEGDDEAVQQFVEWCKHGPPAAHVERVETEDGAPQGHAGFAIARPP